MEAIADTVNRLDITRLGGIVLDLPAQFGDVLIQLAHQVAAHQEPVSPGMTTSNCCATAPPA